MEGPNYVSIWSNNAYLNAKFLKTVRRTNFIQYTHNSHFKIPKYLAHTNSKEKKPSGGSPTAIKISFELLHLVSLIIIVAIASLMVPEEPNDAFLTGQPTTTEFIPTEYDIDALNTKLKRFYAHPMRGIDLNADDLNTFFVSLPSTVPFRQYVNFLPITKECVATSTIPVKVCVPLGAGHYFNCIVYYKIVQKDGRWTTELDRVKPLYSENELSPTTIQFFHRDFLNPNFFRMDSELKKVLSYSQSFQVNRLGLLINLVPVPETKVDFEKEYESVYKNPLYWIDEFPLESNVFRKSIGYSLLFDNEKFE